MNFKIESIFNEKNTDKIPVWSVATSLVVIIGFIGFYTYSSLNKIPFVYPSIQLIIGIGIFNLIIITLMVWALINVNGTLGDKAFRVTLITIFLTYNPGNLGANIILVIMILSTAYWDITLRRSKKKESAEQNSYVPTEDSIRDTHDIMPHVTVLVIGLFFDSSLISKFYLIYYLMFDLIRVYHSRVIELKNLLVFGILFPMAVSFSFLNDTTYSLIGISKVNVEISSNDEPDIFKKFILVYEDKNKYYLKDPSFPENTIVMKESEVFKMNILKPSIFKGRKGLVAELKESWGKSSNEERAKAVEGVKDSLNAPVHMDSIEKQ